MFSKILDCPECKHRFNYDHEGEEFPEHITCPGCGKSSNFAEFSALTICPQCRSKLKIPLDILFDDDLACPSCGAMLKTTESLVEDSDAVTIGVSKAGHGADHRPMSKRMLPDGAIFDKYKIIRLLGKGGMAEVYLAEHLLLKQKCAVKLMQANSGGDSEMAVKRFLREAKLSHHFNHPNIVKVFDVGSDFQTGYLFIAMEYVEGKTLHDMAREKPFTEDELAKVLVSMASALNALAEVHVVHRDIKPSNIMLTPDGVYKLMDLGIAKSDSGSHMAGDMTLTMDQSTIGTPNYASPEQCRSAHSVDLRSDIYSLGATLYHLASGKLPFSGTTAVETILNVMQTEAIPLASHRPDLSEKMLSLIEQMMRKNPDERPQMPDALLAAIYSRKSNSLIKRIKGIFERKGSRSSSKKQSLPAKAIRWAAAAILLFVISMNMKHISNYFRALKEAEQSVAQPQTQKKVDVLARHNPLTAFPDKFGDFNENIIFDKSKKQYKLPKIKFAADNKKDLILSYDFEMYKDEANPQNDGLVSLADSKMDIVIPGNVHVDDFTILLDFYNGKGGNTMLFNIGSQLKVFVYKNKLTIIASGLHFIASNIVVPDNTWANIIISYEKSKRKLIFLSGDRFAGSYLMPNEFSWNRLVLGDKNQIPDRGNEEWLQGKIDKLEIYNCARTIVLPESKEKIVYDFIVSGKRETVAGFQPEIMPAKAETPAPATATEPAPEPAAAVAEAETPKVEPAAPAAESTASNLPAVFSIPTYPELEKDRTIANRLEWCKKRLAMLTQAEKDFPFRNEMIEFVQKQIRELTYQQQTAEKVRKNLAATSQINSDTNRFINIAQKYLWSKKSNPNLWQMESELKKLFESKNINVNAEFQDPVISKKITVGELIFGNNISRSEATINLLKERLADVNKISLDAVFPLHALYFFGLEDVDGAKEATIIRYLKNQRRIMSDDIFVGKAYRIDDARKLLMLAPKLNGITDLNNHTLMHYAVLADDPKFAAELIYGGFTGFEIPITGGDITPWRLALRCGSRKMVEFLKKLGLNRNDKPEDHLQFKMWCAVYDNDLATVEKCLQDGADPYMTNGKSLDLLQAACDLENEKLLALLIKRKIDLNRKYWNRFYYIANHPLTITAAKGNAKMLDMLFAAGCKLDSPPTTLYAPMFEHFRYTVLQCRINKTLIAPQIEEKIVEVLKVIVKNAPGYRTGVVSYGISMCAQRLLSDPRYSQPGYYPGEKIVAYLLSIAPDFRVQDMYLSRARGKIRTMLEEHNNKQAGGQNNRSTSSKSRKRKK